MSNLLFLIAAGLVVFWPFDYFGYHASGLLHILLVIGVITAVLRVIRREPV